MPKPAKQNPKQLKHAKLKIAAIPLLLGVLVYVLTAGEEEPVVELAVAEGAVASPAAPAATDPSVSPPPVATVTWPEVDFAALREGNPFASYRIPEPTPPPAEPLAQRESASSGPDRPPAPTTAAVPPAKPVVDYIFESSRRKLVRVDGRLVEQGSASESQSPGSSHGSNVPAGTLILTIHDASDPAAQSTTRPPID